MTHRRTLILLAAAVLLPLLPLPHAAAQSAGFSEPQFLPGDGGVGPAVGIQDRADIARGGDRYLAVWNDYRTSPDDGPPFASEGCGSDIYAVRLDAAGNAIDNAPIMVTEAFGDQVDPQAAWNGQHWLVVWESPNQTYWDAKLQAVRIASDGTILDDPPIVVHESGSKTNFRVAGGEGGWVVLLQASSAGESDLRAVRIAGDGTVPEPDGIQLLETSFLLDFDLAFAQDEYLLIWSGVFDGAHAQRFTADLAPIDAAPFTLPWGTRVTTDGDDFLVAWHDNGGPQAFVSAARVSHDGVVLDPAGFTVATLFYVQDGVDVAWDGQHYWIAWQQTGTEVQMARVTASGTVLDPDGFPVSPDTANVGGVEMAGAASGGTQLVWNDAGSLNTDKDVHAASVSPAGQIGPTTTVSSGAPAQLGADLAEGPGTHLVVFQSRLSGSTRILAQRLDAGGAALDPEPIELASGPTLGDPAAAFNGSLYFVTWSDGSSIFGRRLLPDGTIVDPAPLNVMPGFSPDVAALGDVFLVAGVYYLLDNIQWQATFSMRVDGATGELLDVEPYAIGGFVIFARHPHVVRWLDRWLVTWQTNISHDDPVAKIVGAFVDANGTSPGVFVVTYGAGWRPDVAVSGDRALFVWSNGSIASADNDIEGLVMLPDGTFTGPEFTIADEPDKQLSPTVSFDGSEFIAAWKDKRNAAVYFDERTDIYGARVAADGTVLDPSGVAIASGILPEVDVALLSLGGQTLVAASTFRDDPEFEAYRIGIQTGDLSPTPGDVNDDGEVNIADLLLVLTAWGPCPGCPEDIDGDGSVGMSDLLTLLANWS